MTNRKEVTQSIVRELLEYYPSTGEFVWKPRGRHWFSHCECPQRTMNQWNSRFAGKRAGNIKAYPKGKFYRRLMVDHRLHYEHRIAWLWMEGYFPSEQIDHINRIGTDNRWCNLRLADNLTNSRNRGVYETNSSGFTGVQKRYTSSGRIRWMASIYVEYQNIYLGVFDTMEEAIECREEANRKYEFHSNHGIEPPLDESLENGYIKANEGNKSFVLTKQHIVIEE